MVQDFTNVGIQPKRDEEADRLAEAIRAGRHPRTSASQPSYEMARIKDEAPFFLSAPTKFLRQITTGGFELLEMLKFGLGFLVFLIPSVMCSYFVIFGRFEWDIFWMTVALDAATIFLARKTLHAAKNIRTIAKA